MKLTISKGNSKIGGVPNISLTPGASCAKGVPCFKDSCYAIKSYRQYPNVRNAWDKNLKLYNEKPWDFFDQLYQWFCKNNPKLFRLFVSGDFPDEKFYLSTEDLAREFSETQFLAFTKRYKYNYGSRPKNLQIILSTWPGWPLPTNKDLPWAWLEEDPRRPKTNYYMCPGHCGTDTCDFKCWSEISVEVPVIFKRH